MRMYLITMLLIITMLLEANWCQQSKWLGNGYNIGVVNSNVSETRHLSGMNNRQKNGNSNRNGKESHNGNASENGYTNRSTNKPESKFKDTSGNRSEIQKRNIPEAQAYSWSWVIGPMLPGTQSKSSPEKEQSAKTSNQKTNTSTLMQPQISSEMAIGKTSNGSSTTNVTRLSGPPTDKIASVEKEITTHKTIDTTENIQGNKRRKNTTFYEKYLDPPLDFFPLTTPEAPELLSAGAHKLKFLVRIPCTKPDCPAEFIWSYKEVDQTCSGISHVASFLDGFIEEPEPTATVCHLASLSQDGRQWKNALHKHSWEYIGGISSTASLTNLQKDTKYYVRVLPKKRDSFYTPSLNWYINVNRHSPYSPSSTGLTCDEEQEGMRDLLLHSAGPKWLALSWEPPIPKCNTYLEYHVRYNAELLPGGAWERIGAFWSNATWSLEGNVKPCSLWPGRHCLLIMNNIDPDKNYIIQLKVIRAADNITSEIHTVSQYSAPFGPSSPFDLQCVEAQPTSLKLRWRSPLKIGSRLSSVHIRVKDTAGNGNYNATYISKEVEIRPKYQLMIEGLNPLTLYHVTVWFESFGGFNGSSSTLSVCTASNSTMEEGSTISVSSHSPDNCSNLFRAVASRTIEDLDCGSSLWWAWTLVALSLIAVAVLAFFVGRRWTKHVANRHDARTRYTGSLQLYEYVGETQAQNDTKTKPPNLALPPLPIEHRTDMHNGYLIPKSLPHECIPMHILQHVYEYPRIILNTEQKSQL